MRKKILRSMMLLTVLGLLLGTAALCVAFYGQLSASVRAELKERASVFKEILDKTPEAYASLSPADMRITLVAADGAVLYDDDESLQAMDNHLDRQEIRQALSQGTGESKRFSSTLRQETYYYTLRLEDGRVLRLAKTTSSIWGLFYGIVPYAALILLGLLLFTRLAAHRLTQSIVAPINNLDPEQSLSVPYDELAPFARTIGKQREQIGAQLRDLGSRAQTTQAIISSMREGIALVDPKGIILSANQSALAAFDLQGDMSGKSVLELFRDVELSAHVQGALKGQHAQAEYRHLGRIYQVLFSPAAGGGAMVLLLDVTERSQGEQMRREFSANVSHELKTPLTSISGYAEMIAGGLVQEPELRQFAGKIQSEAARLLALIDDIIMLSQLDESGGEALTQRVNLAHVARDAVRDLEEKAAQAQVSMRVETPDAWVPGRETMLYEMLHNLLDNAIKYNHPGGSVAVTLAQKDGQALLTVSDTGVGIPKEHQSRVFERFYRVDPSHSKKTGGTGLGLSIVKHVAAAHGGSLRLKSAPGQGTAITVTLPLAP
ncbi:MAG: ATP-binding protein [Candidatus Limiplasma sp.]|nr:ATP-binding protein [Candidatus Limiplasma sp.]